MVEIDGVKLLFDPFISGNEAAISIDVSDIHPDFILLSHGHQDHILDADGIARQSGAAIVATFEVANYFANMDGIDKTIPMNHGGIVDCDGVKVKMMNAVHTSSFPDGSYAGQPAGFMVFGSHQSFYYSGDTALHYDMKLIAEQWDTNFAFLCLGDHFTMGIDDAIRAAEFVGTQSVIGMHFDTFPPIQIDHNAAMSKFRDNGLTLKLPQIGETFTL
jgi:L-ascorbate metabolism protein UlaG (beta-lactamase superfamily)